MTREYGDMYTRIVWLLYDLDVINWDEAVVVGGHIDSEIAYWDKHEDIYLRAGKQRS